jgi:hypothetical protein
VHIDVNNFHSTIEVARKIQEALNNSQGLSLVRVGDGEARAIGHDMFNTYPSIEQLDWIDYAGIKLPDEIVRDMILIAIEKSDIVGFRPDRTRSEVERILTHFNKNLTYTCSAGINWDLYNQGLLYQLMRNKRILLVGRLSELAASVLRNQGFIVNQHIVLEGFYDLNRVYYYIKNSTNNFDIALISAGIPAVVLSYWIANRLGKVAIDLGHVVNKIIDSNFGPNKHTEAVIQWRYSQKCPIYPDEILLIKSPTNPKIYFYSYGYKHHIANVEIQRKYNLNFMAPIILPDNIIDKIPDGPVIK